MAADIIPIELSLTDGDSFTLWAPQWQEDGEDWEAFLGHGDHLYVFPDVAHVAAFIRCGDEHDLTDHPEWLTAQDRLADELIPDEDHEFDIVGLPELISGQVDVWVLAEITDTVAILRSLAEVCDLTVIDEVLDLAPGFAAASQGPTAFVGRAGRKLWNQIGSVVAKRWDDVVEALDSVAMTPDVDADALATAQAEIDAVQSIEARSGADDESLTDDTYATESDTSDTPDEEREPDLEFWDEVGIDCISVTAGGRTGWTLRCYLDDKAVFLSEGNKTQLFSSPASLEEYLADPISENTLSHLDAWTTIREGVAGGEASVIAGPENRYVLDGLDEQLARGPEETDAGQLELAIELLEDGADARSDNEVATALSTAAPLGNLIRAVTKPDPARLPPSPPFDDEAAAFKALTETFEAQLTWR